MQLSEEKKKEIYEIIAARTEKDARSPAEVIAERFGGDEEKYLIAMAHWHGIKI